MKPLEYPLLLDENITPAVASVLTGRGMDVTTVTGAGLGGAKDTAAARRGDEVRVRLRQLG